MKPEELLDPDQLPAELKLLAERHKLQLTDPVFLLIAWHWQNVQGAESKLAQISLEMQARARILIQSADSVTAISGQLALLKTALEAKPLDIARQLEEELAAPVATTVAALGAAERALRRSVDTVEKARRREALAAFVIGVALGGSALAWLTL
jgi:hypothetical protein